MTFLRWLLCQFENERMGEQNDYQVDARVHVIRKIP